MGIDFVWKALLLLSAGALGALVLVKVLSPGSTNPVLGQKVSISERVRSTVQKQEKDQINSIKSRIVDKVLPAITENPILSPILRTSREVEEAVQTVRSLPDDQKNAICQQVCQ
ncbi:MAG: hypothetical protein HYU80_01740 [Candidatus Blackburnbacteria bacterium]|nr:hypothetical protein [Candidatus Blackburnbacteria bacterium]